MKQSNFILSDVMKTGDHVRFESYINYNSLTEQSFVMENEYYALHTHDLTHFDRKFAMVDMRQVNKWRFDCEDFKADFSNRIKKLKSLGFGIIYATPWESKDNFTNTRQSYFPLPSNDDYIWYGGVSWFWVYMLMKHNKNYKTNHTDKHFDFLYLNKQPRPHRLKLYDKLQNEDVLSNSLTSFVSHPTKPYDLDKRYELPWLDNTKHYPHNGMDQDIYALPYEKTKVSIISETNDNNFEVFITEQLWKPVLMHHPFVVHGNLHYLKKIKELGFKTFDNVFDESYDNEQDPNERINKLVGTCLDIKKSMLDIYELTKEARTHNYKQFFNTKSLASVVNQEILSWFEFFDSGKISSAKS